MQQEQQIAIGAWWIGRVWCGGGENDSMMNLSADSLTVLVQTVLES